MNRVRQNSRFRKEPILAHREKRVFGAVVRQRSRAPAREFACRGWFSPSSGGGSGAWGRFSVIRYSQAVKMVHVPSLDLSRASQTRLFVWLFVCLFGWLFVCVVCRLFVCLSGEEGFQNVRRLTHGVRRWQNCAFPGPQFWPQKHDPKQRHITFPLEFRFGITVTSTSMNTYIAICFVYIYTDKHVCW
jgi:hypothetical protein